MRYVLAALLVLGGGAIASPAIAQDPSEALAQCAWSRAATTSATLVGRARFDRQYVYDADGTPTVGLIMRIRAACPNESQALRPRSGQRADLRAFLRRLRATQPRSASADSYTEPVFRCETRFLDAPPDSPPAAVGWGFGADFSQHQLSYTATIEGHGHSLAGDALDDPEALSQLLEQAQRMDAAAIETETAAEGRASGQPFRVRDGGGQRACQLIQPDGRYTVP